MKIPQEKKQYCKFCKTHTINKVIQIKGKDRGSLKRGSITRAMKRGLGRGYGNLGRYGSKPPISQFKRTGAKIAKKTNIKFKCTVCNKESIKQHNIRTKRLEFSKEK